MLGAEAAEMLDLFVGMGPGNDRELRVELPGPLGNGPTFEPFRDGDEKLGSVFNASFVQHARLSRISKYDLHSFRLSLAGGIALVLYHDQGTPPFMQLLRNAAADAAIADQNYMAFAAALLFLLHPPLRLALSLATEGGFEGVTALDISADALALAEENRATAGARVHLVRGDLCGPLGAGALDAVVSNPPYLTAGEYAALDPSVKRWEPAAALVSGSDGLQATSRLLHDARAVLRAGGWLALEVDCTRAAAAAALAGALGWTDVAIHADLFGRERYLLARRSADT